MNKKVDKIVNTIFNGQFIIMHLNSEIQDYRTMQLRMIHRAYMYAYNIHNDIGPTVYVSFVIEFAQCAKGILLR